MYWIVGVVSSGRAPRGVLGFVCVALLAAGAVAEGSDRPLFEAVERGEPSAVRRLLQQGVRADVAAADGTTPLHWAIRANHLDVARVLLAAGASPRAADRYGVTPLALAAINGSAAAIDLLLQAGADPTAASGEGQTVLMLAARTGRPDAVRRLLTAGADPNAVERGHGETALMWAAAHDHAEAVALLVAGGAKPDARSTQIDLPPAKVDLATMVTTALPRGGMTAAMYAAREGASRGVAALAEAGADLDLGDPDGTTALIFAIINGHFDTAAVLLEKGADPDRADSVGMTALYAAVDMVYPPTLLNRPPIRFSTPPTGPELVRMMLARGADPNLPLRAPLLMRQHSTGDASLGDGATPLMRAAKVPDLNLMRMLLDAGANPSAAQRNGSTALTIASSARAARPVTPDAPVYQAVDLLLERGADVNAANAAGETLLHQSVARGEAFVRMLVRHGARVDVTDKAGRTPLDVALGVPAPAAAGGRAGRGGRAGGGFGGRGGAPEAEPARADDATLRLLREAAAPAGP